MAEQKSHHYTHLRHQVASWGRWLHIYLSMASFAILFFFAVTGLTLNHTDWFSAQQRTAQLKGNVETKWVQVADAEVNKLALVEHLRNTHGIKGALSDLRLDDAQCAVSFKGPGYAADAFINRETGAYELTETRSGFVAVLNDLHKGRDSGRVWSWLIDLSAVLMTLVSLTGMLLIWFVKKRRMSGLILAGVGAVVCYLVYVIWIP
ncbi:MAG: PepSY-associated TM helix domain-containing protein [Acidobacteria bacterium]|nr:PepSY-associated TM helix domain-containing protein [Acidobacteriota bacterium]MBI3421918.1 PepSY-associated TM helix domain-containing protein [Acidobacteriota bacterium]